MPALDVDKPGVSAVDTFGKLLSELVDEATMANDADLPNISARAVAALPPLETPQEEDKEADKTRQFAIIEGAARDLFDRLIVRLPEYQPEDTTPLLTHSSSAGINPHRGPRVRPNVALSRHPLRPL